MEFIKLYCVLIDSEVRIAYTFPGKAPVLFTNCVACGHLAGEAFPSIFHLQGGKSHAFRGHHKSLAIKWHSHVELFISFLVNLGWELTLFHQLRP